MCVLLLIHSHDVTMSSWKYFNSDVFDPCREGACYNDSIDVNMG